MTQPSGAQDNASPVKLRPARSDDAGFLFDLRQEPEVIRYSTTGRGIEWDSHVAWLERKLADPNCRLWIVEDQSGTRVGQIRLDLEPRRAEVSIAFAPEHRGRGYARVALREACGQAARIPGVEAVTAVIHGQNVKSQRLFQDVGFLLDTIDREFLHLTLTVDESMPPS